MKYIPKIIHLVWFGRNPYSLIVEQCIKSWKKICADYELMIWNEDTFDIESNTFVKEAYESKKWAFVSDYVRLYALYNYGGVYIDSDVELLQSFEKLFENEHCVTGYEGEFWIPAAIMASEPRNEWIKLLLDYYSDVKFINEDGSYNMKANTAIITELSKKKCGFRIGDLTIKTGAVKLYPSDYFQPYKKKQFDFNDLNSIAKCHEFYDLKECTICIHHNTVTWTKDNSSKKKFKAFIRTILPKSAMESARRLYYRFHKW